MITRKEIQNRIKILAQLIHEDYAGERPVMVCVLKGANPFYQNLLEALQDLKHGYTMEFLKASSYEGNASTGNVRIESVNFEALEDKHIILVEDTVDTGTTLAQVIPFMHTKCNLKSVHVCTLLEKRLDSPPRVKAKYKGFSIPNHFIVGYGLDYNELYRDVRDIWVISQAGIDFDSSVLYS
jgi:hypoxanthine phosphoribosyltransferase